MEIPYIQGQIGTLKLRKIWFLITLAPNVLSTYCCFLSVLIISLMVDKWWLSHSMSSTYTSSQATLRKGFLFSSSLFIYWILPVWPSFSIIIYFHISHIYFQNISYFASRKFFKLFLISLWNIFPIFWEPPCFLVEWVILAHHLHSLLLLLLLSRFSHVQLCVIT